MIGYEGVSCDEKMRGYIMRRCEKGGYVMMVCDM